jgi:hypothetical protein
MTEIFERMRRRRQLIREPNTSENETGHFPENEIEILDSYLIDDYFSEGFIKDVLKGLTNARLYPWILISEKSPNRELVEKIRSSREDLIRFLEPILNIVTDKSNDAGEMDKSEVILKEESLHGFPQHQEFRKKLDEIITEFSKGHFSHAKMKIDELERSYSRVVLDIESALLRESVSYKEAVAIAPPDGTVQGEDSGSIEGLGEPFEGPPEQTPREPVEGPPGQFGGTLPFIAAARNDTGGLGKPTGELGELSVPEVGNSNPMIMIVDRMLPGYTGPVPSTRPGERLIEYGGFFARGEEFTFRVSLLRAETAVGLQNFEEALDIYKLLSSLSFIKRGSPRYKFLAIRSAFAELAWGNQLFRKERRPKDRQAIIDHYDAAVQLLVENEVSAENPLRKEVEAYASHQKAKLQSGLNYLGLWDGFVPPQRYTTLKGLADNQIASAQLSAQAFMHFLEKAQSAKTTEMQLNQQQEEEISNRDILLKREDIASETVKKITEQLMSIDEQNDFLLGQTVVGGIRAMVEGGIKGEEPGGAMGAIGIIGAGVNFFAQSNELSHLKRIAEIDKEIAEKEASIALIQGSISDDRIAFYEEQRAHLGEGLTSNVLYLLAKFYEKRCERQLEYAILLAYLYERSVAFFLGIPDMKEYIRLDYLDQLGSIVIQKNPLTLEEEEGQELPADAKLITAADSLRSHFDELYNTEFADINQNLFNYFTESISLSESYPLQFQQFQQTGEMEFVYSLYQLSKRFPDTHQCRLREVGVEIKGSIPARGFSGTLTHNGRYLVRDQKATLHPDVTRLVPTNLQLDQALEQQRQQGLPVAAVGGVLYYNNFESQSRTLTHMTQYVSNRPPEQFTLDIFEGHGPTGLWKLKIRDHEELHISDILIHFAIVSLQPDEAALGPKVEELVRLYELELADGDQLDRISVISLFENEDFKDVFFALESGSADLPLSEKDFPLGLTNLKTKMVIAQALDPDGKGIPGIALEISRPEFGFNQQRVTREDGFTEDLDAPPQMLDRDQRFPVIGTWQIRLSDPTQFILMMRDPQHIGDLRLLFMYAFEES